MILKLKRFTKINLKSFVMVSDNLGVGKKRHTTILVEMLPEYRSKKDFVDTLVSRNGTLVLKCLTLAIQIITTNYFIVLGQN